MKNNKGFSLVELSIVIVIIALMLVTAFAGGQYFLNQNQIKATNVKLNAIQKAMEMYVRRTGHLPCPSYLTENTGVEVVNCQSAANNSLKGFYKVGNFISGGIPYRDLNLAADMSYDAWGGKFTYKVYIPATENVKNIDRREGEEYLAIYQEMKVEGESQNNTTPPVVKPPVEETKPEEDDSDNPFAGLIDPEYNVIMTNKTFKSSCGIRTSNGSLRFCYIQNDQGKVFCPPALSTGVRINSTHNGEVIWSAIVGVDIGVPECAKRSKPSEPEPTPEPTPTPTPTPEISSDVIAQAMYSLTSYGKDKVYAYDFNTNKQMSMTTSGIIAGSDNKPSVTNKTVYFVDDELSDDIVRYKTINQIIQDAEIINLDCCVTTSVINDLKSSNGITDALNFGTNTFNDNCKYLEYNDEIEGTGGSKRYKLKCFSYGRLGIARVSEE